MKKLFSILLILLLLAGGVLAYLYSQRDRLATGCIEKYLETLTGVAVDVEGVHVTSLGKKITVAKIVIHNPEGWKDPILAQVSNVVLESKGLLTRNKKHFQRIAATVDSVNVEQDKFGETNLGRLNALRPDEIDKAMAQKPDFLVERLEYSIGQMHFAEILPGQDVEAKTEVDFQGRMELYEQVRDPYILIQIPAVKVVEALNKGSLGLPRGKLVESLQEGTGVKTE